MSAAAASRLLGRGALLLGRRCHGLLGREGCGVQRWAARRAAASPVEGAFRQQVQLDGVTIVSNDEGARRALQELHRLRARPHAWDTETSGLTVGRGSQAQSPVTHGHIICATCFCGDDADFGSGPRLFIDNTGPSAGLLLRFQEYFEDSGFKKVFHHYAFDRHMLKRHGIQLRGFHADTLHLARLYDTSLASWEGEVQRKLRRKGGAGATAETQGQAGPAGAHHPPAGAHACAQVLGKTILGARIGGVRLEKKAWNAASGLHSLAARSPEPALGSSSGTGTAPAAMPAKSGYGLKDLAVHFGLTSGCQPHFAELFGTHESAGQEVHDSPERFGAWVGYATTDAVLTHGLFGRLEGELRRRSWTTQVHKRSIEDVLQDPAVAAELLSKTPCTYASVQYATSRTMWDFAGHYLCDYAVCLADLEEVGVGVDRERLRDIEARASKEADECRREFTERIGSARGPDGNLLNPDAGRMNVKSSCQIQTLLFGGAANREDRDQVLETTRLFPAPPGGAGPGKRAPIAVNSLRLEPANRMRDVTPRGWPKTSSGVIRKLVGDPAKLADSDAYRQLVRRGFDPEQALGVSQGLLQLSEASRITHLLSGFVKPLLGRTAATGRIHPSWNFDTATGRLTCTKPNLQCLPGVQQDKYRVRDAIRAGAGQVFIISDYSQLELRTLAHVTNCQSMIASLTRGGDYHSEVAAEMFPHVREAVAKGEAVINGGSSASVPTVKARFGRERSSAKAVNFGILFGMGPKTLAEDLGIKEGQAKELVEAWYQSKPEVKAWTHDMQKYARTHGYAVSMLGRWRNFPLLARPDDVEPKYIFQSLRAAVNFGIQGSAADLVMAAMLRLWRSPRLARLGFRIVLQIHDEFVLEGPGEYADEAREVVRDAMMNPFQEDSPGFSFRVPLEVDIAVAQSLGDVKG